MEGSSDHMNIENFQRKRKRTRGVRVEEHDNNELVPLLKRPWSNEEDEIFSAYVKEHGERDLYNIHRLTNLKRCGKCCRLRWLNHLRPDLKHDPSKSSIMPNNISNSQETRCNFHQGELNSPPCDSAGAYTCQRTPVNMVISEICQPTQTIIGYEEPVVGNNQGPSSPPSIMEEIMNILLPPEPETLSQLGFAEPENVI